MRNIIRIDEKKCNGCGKCVINCAEGALRIVKGKARVIKDSYCDGLGACVGKCPRKALKIIRREASAFDEEAVKEHIAKKNGNKSKTIVESIPSSTCKTVTALPACQSEDTKGGGKSVNRTNKLEVADEPQSLLGHWPIKLYLLPPSASFLRDKELVLMADCVGVARRDVQGTFLNGRSVAIGCPKFDNTKLHMEKLTQIIRDGGITGITIVHMEVPCCFGLARIVQDAMKNAGRRVPVAAFLVRLNGTVEEVAH